MIPTPEQSLIYSHALSPEDLLVVALAGTGKTTTISELCKFFPPTQITLALAFNVKIKEELSERLPSFVKCLTINGLGNLAWKNQLGKFPQVDTKKTYNVIDQVIADQGLWFTREEKADLKSLTDAAKALGWVPSGLPMQSFPTLRDENFLEIFDWVDVDYSDQYLTALRAIMHKSIMMGYQGIIDFNDQIYLPVVFRAPVPKYDTVLVDEAQDLSLLNHRLILAACKRRLIAVGDPNQAIYAFRGASSTSIDDLRQQRNFIELPLTTTFRCAKAIVKRQQAFVPDYRAAEGNPEGEVLDWTEGSSQVAGGMIDPPIWGSADIPNGTAIICRNNAPLLSLAFKLIRAKRPCKMLGRDIGLALKRKLEKACKGLVPSASSKDMYHALQLWRTAELKKAKTSRKEAAIEDSFDCLRAIIDEVTSFSEAKKFCDELFADKAATVELCSGHRSKGLEWNTVIHLDPWRIPSKYAVTDADFQQEANLKYVIETRAKNTLILANLEDFE